MSEIIPEHTLSHRAAPSSGAVPGRTGVSFNTTRYAAYQWAFTGFWVGAGLVSGAGFVVLLAAILMELFGAAL